MKKVFLVSLMMLTACSAGAPPSVLRDSTCNLPCWNDIVPGQTSEAEFLGILSRLRIVDQASVTEVGASGMLWHRTVFFSLYPGRSQGNFLVGRRAWASAEANTLDDKIGDLWLCGNIGVTFGDVIQRSGEPESILTMADYFSGGLWGNAINPTKGVAFSFETQRNAQAELGPETKVRCLLLFDPGIYRRMLEAGSFSGGDYDAVQVLKILYAWDGYGRLLEKYPPRSPY